jgi:hypothetical protein
VTPAERAARRALCGLAVAALLGAGCRRGTTEPDVRVRFGVFFGGQVQEREQIPLVVDRARQTIGLRLEFADAPAAERRVAWELEKPAGKKPSEATRVVAYGEAKTRIGQAVLDVPLAFQESDRPGAWRVRVDLDGKRVLDRPFTVIPASEAPAED